MIHALIDPFVEFAFMRRALVGCFALSLGAPPVGVAQSRRGAGSCYAMNRREHEC